MKRVQEGEGVKDVGLSEKWRFGKRKEGKDKKQESNRYRRVSKGAAANAFTPLMRGGGASK